MIFTNIDSSLCTDRRRPAAARAALCEGKQWFQNGPFCKETILLKWTMLSKAGVATKYLLSCRDHNVPWFIWIIKLQYCTRIVIAASKHLLAMWSWQSTSLFNGWLLQQRRGNLFQTKLCFPKGQKLSIVISIPYRFLLLLYILKIYPLLILSQQIRCHFTFLSLK